jgi:acyl-CoA reductase-like NAD-dependent aldehyde dehydrogenase
MVPIVPFKDLHEPVDYMIQSDFGQQVSIFSKNHEEIAKMIDGFVNLVSRVNVNTQSQEDKMFSFHRKKRLPKNTFCTRCIAFFLYQNNGSHQRKRTE